MIIVSKVINLKLIYTLIDTSFNITNPTTTGLWLIYSKNKTMKRTLKFTLRNPLAKLKKKKKFSKRDSKD